MNDSQTAIDIRAAEVAAVAAEKAKVLEQDLRSHERQCSARWQRIVWTMVAIIGFLLVTIFREQLLK